MPRKKTCDKRPLDSIAESAHSAVWPQGWNNSFQTANKLLVERSSSKGFPTLPLLECLVSIAREFPLQKRFEYYGSKLNGTLPLDRIKYCSQALLNGALPDAATLQFIAMAFDKYISSGGSLSLDESFGLKSKPKAGNPVRQEARRNRIGQFLYWMAEYRRHDPKISIARAAEVALRDDESIPAETLEREYKRRGYDRFARDSGK